MNNSLKTNSQESFACCTALWMAKGCWRRYCVCRLSKDTGQTSEVQMSVVELIACKSYTLHEMFEESSSAMLFCVLRLQMLLCWNWQHSCHPSKSQPCILKAVMWLSRIKYYQIADMLLAPSDTSCRIAISDNSVGTIPKAVWGALDPIQTSCFESEVDLETVTLPLEFLQYCYQSQLLWCGFWVFL